MKEVVLVVMMVSFGVAGAVYLPEVAARIMAGLFVFGAIGAALSEG